MSTIDIPGYKIVKTLGVGGQATVYLAIQKGFDREVALKVMSPALAADPTFGERFIREAKIVAKLSHKSIVTVYDVGESGSFYYLAMEYLPGGDLKSKIANGMKAKEALTIISKLARALHFAHDKGYIHRDVKSENILFDIDGEPLLTDFGIAKASNSSTQMTQTGKLIGTPEYMSPEQCRGKTVDARSDLYSLGVILYEMLTKGVPYTGEDSVAVCIKHVTKPVPTLPVRLKHFQWLIDLLLAKEASKRFQDGLELSKAIDDFKTTGKQTDKLDSNTSKAKVKASPKKAVKPERPFVATDEEIEEFDDLHSEARAFIQEEPKSRVGSIVFIVILVLIGAGGFLSKDKWLPQLEAMLQQEQQKTPVKPTTTKNEELSSNTVRKQSESDKAKEINAKESDIKEQAAPNSESLLAEADLLTQPKPLLIANVKKALQLIGTVRTLDATNKNADLAYSNIINMSLAEAATQAESLKFDLADQWLKLVEVESPDHALLDATKQKVSELAKQFEAEQSKEAAASQKLELTLAKADKALRENRLSTPPEDNAIALYKEVLAIEPENLQAKEGLEKVASAYESLINKAVIDKSFDRARSMLTRFNEISSDNNLKSMLKDKITNAEKSHKAAEAEKQRLAKLEKQRIQVEKARAEKLSDPLVQMKLSSSLDSAKALESQMQLVLPEGNNALEKYRNVLEIDDRNQDAKDGVERIEALILAALTEKIANSNKSEALEWLSKLQIYQPQHPQYDSYKSAIENIVVPSIDKVKKEQSGTEKDSSEEELESSDGTNVKSAEGNEQTNSDKKSDEENDKENSNDETKDDNNEDEEGEEPPAKGF